jgi:hypothetical protein
MDLSGKIPTGYIKSGISILKFNSMKKFRLPSLATLLFAAVLTMFFIPMFGAEVSTGFGVAVVLSSYLPMPVNVLGLNNTNNTSARESFAHAQRMFFKAFRDKFNSDQACQAFVNQLKLSQSEIRLEVELSAGPTSFVFGVTPNQVNTNNFQFPTERRLVLQDSICVNEYGIYVGQAPSRTSAAWTLRTYGNTQDFAAATALALDQTFFSQGTFILKCNNDVIMPYRGLFNHWYKPQTQQTAALGAASPGDQIRGAEDGQITDEPNIVIIGSKNYIPSIELPAGLASTDTVANAGSTRAILIMRGIYAQNSTVVS